MPQRKAAAPSGTHRCELRTNSKARAASDAIAASVKSTFAAGLSQPALRALAEAGFTGLDQLTRRTEREIAELHGLGPKGIRILRVALAADGKASKRA